MFCADRADRAVKSRRYVVRYIPSWFPGAVFKRDAKRLRGLVETMTYRPFDQVKAEVVSTIFGSLKIGQSDILMGFSRLPELLHLLLHPSSWKAALLRKNISSGFPGACIALL